jgi:hypothetical protein
MEPPHITEYAGVGGVIKMETAGLVQEYVNGITVAHYGFAKVIVFEWFMMKIATKVSCFPRELRIKVGVLFQRNALVVLFVA